MSREDPPEPENPNTFITTEAEQIILELLTNKTLPQMASEQTVKEE